MSSNGGRRKTPRENAGRGPDRYGDPVDTSGTKNKKDLKITFKDDTKSKASGGSKRSSLFSKATFRSINSQLHDIDDKTEKAIAELTSEHRVREKQLKLMKIQLTEVESEITKLESEWEEEKEETAKAVITIKLVEKKEEFRSLKVDIARADVTLEYEVLDLEEKIKSLRRESAAEKRDLEDETESENKSELDKLEETSKWAENVLPFPPDNQVDDQPQQIPNFSEFAQTAESSNHGHLITMDWKPNLFSTVGGTATTATPEMFSSTPMASFPATTPATTLGGTQPPTTACQHQGRITRPSTLQVGLTNRAPTPGGTFTQPQHTTRAFFPTVPQSSSTDKYLARQVQGRDLPTFSGRPEEWPAFLNAYNNSTQFCQFSDSENLIRLQKCLKGEAKELTECLLLHPQNVPVALDRLKMRFGQPEQIIGTMLAKVRAVPAVRLDKPETIIKFGTMVDNLTSMIKSLNCVGHLNNPILIQELVEKLPPAKRLDWARFQQTQNWRNGNLEVFANWFRPDMEAACSLGVGAKSEEPKWERKRRNEDRVLVADDHQKKSSFHSNSQKTRNKLGNRNFSRPNSCEFCSRSGHQIIECYKFKNENNDGRWNHVKSKRLCFCCLSTSHQIQNCPKKKPCGVENCEKYHHQLLHQVPPNPEKPEIKAPTVPNEMMQFARDAPFINLQMIPVKLKGPNATINTFMMLDNGSTLSAVEESIAEALGLEGEKTVLRVAGFQTEATNMESQIVSLKIQSNAEDFEFDLNNVKTVRNLNLRSQSVRASLLQRWKHLEGINLEKYENKRPGILIGSDNPALLIQLEHRLGNGNAPVAVKTPLGWTLMGNTAWTSREQYGYHIREETEDSLHQLVKSHFSTESFGVLPLVEKPRSKDDKRAQAILDTTIRRVEGGWECGLLWKDENVELPKSRAMALSRLHSMERKMDRDPDFATKYQEKINEYQQKKFARLLTPAEAAVETPSTFYLPHFMAFNPKKPGKLRFVFDAAAKCRGGSLNDHLLQGPDKLVSLPGVLLKFRQRQIGFTADIEDMFHRVRVIPEDVQAQRFLWRGMDREKPPDVYQMQVLIFGATCSPTCAQEVKNRNAAEFQQEHPDAYAAIVQRHYVDDYLDSCDTVAEATNRYEEVRKIQLHGGFNLCNWLSSSTKMMDHIPEDLKAKSMKSLTTKEDSVMERVLGLFWRPDDDAFTFSLNFLRVEDEILNGGKIPTKREILSLVMSIYDPLGFLAVLTVKAKIILQQTWISKIGWDDQVPSPLVEPWRKWLQHVRKIPEFNIRRCYSPHFSKSDNNQLHVFCDASQEAFGVAAYLRVKKNEEVDVILIMAKSKVAPLRPLSIPRLELQAAVLGSRLAKFICEEIEVEIHQTIYWSDSTTVIRWLRSDARFQQFVAQRIGEIHELTNVEQWRWIPTEENVADELTRLSSPFNLNSESRWINGPPFLKENEDCWPQETWNQTKAPESDPEVRENHVFHVQEISPTFDFTRFSSWIRVTRTIAYVRRVAGIARGGTAEKNWKIIPPEELVEAHLLLCKISQQESFPEDYVSLANGFPLRKTSRLFKLSPYLDDDGIIRLRGRLDNASELSNQVRRPVIMDPKHPYTRLFIAHYHQQCGHHGQERIANEIRQQAYIFHLRQAVKSVQRDCQICKNRMVTPRPPEMGLLPPSRLEAYVFPFHHTGVDYFGPIEVVVKRSREKRYGVLFTCLSTRAIHLEIANSLTTDSCILAIRRFVGRRGNPAHIYSDNGTNFRGTVNELRESLRELNSEKIEKICATKGINWHFNPPAAPHMGGSWERMVRSVKVALGAVLKTKNLHDEVLGTLMVEAEHTVNSHPLTHVPVDPDDEEALTPNHFLVGRSSNLQPIGKFDESDLVSKKQYRVVQQLANHFWRRWIREFLPTLLRREKWCEPSQPIQIGDIVVEVNEALERNRWPKAIVTRVHPGKDGIIRVVEVKTGSGSTYTRPVAKLCILDVRRQPDPMESLDSQVCDIDPDVNMSGSMSPRKKPQEEK